MAISLPSKKILIADVPEVKNFNSEFLYNFFIEDEQTNDTGKLPFAFIENINDNTSDSKFINSKNFQNKIPRAIKFTWKPVVLNTDSNVITKYYNDIKVAKKISIKNNLSKIKYENEFIEKSFTSIETQDNEKNKKLNFFIERALSEFNIKKNNNSLLDVSKELNKKLSTDVTSDYISNILNNLSDNGINFINTNKKEIVSNTIIDKIKNIKLNNVINNKVLTHLMNSSIENITNVYQTDTSQFIERINQIQNHAIETDHSSLLSEGEYDLFIDDYLFVKKVDNSFDSVMIPIGYIIEKYEILKDNSRIKKESLIVENPYTSVTYDTQIKYGSKYLYKIKTICYIETSAIEQQTGEIISLSFLLSSKNSEEKTVICTEMVHPPSPADFSCHWDYVKQNLTIMWSFPPNQQRDIKYFQVFRRRTITEPFELIKMYDFDNSEILSTNFETPEKYLVEKLSNPKTFYTDLDFKKESKFIYSICSLDAHGLTSNYSIQYEISFDKFKNKINKKLISVSGAPKSYPNMFLNQDTFVDVIKDSNHKRLKIYFNPEYLEVIDNNYNDLKVLRTKTDASYKLQIINIDLQQEQDIIIKLEDRRTTMETDILKLIK